MKGVVTVCDVAKVVIVEGGCDCVCDVVKVVTGEGGCDCVGKVVEGVVTVPVTL